MAENNDNNSFTKRFTNRTHGDTEGGYPENIHLKTPKNVHWEKKEKFLN